MEFNISVELANQILGYLGNRPYQEVFSLIDGIKEAAKVLEEKPAPEVKNDG